MADKLIQLIEGCMAGDRSCQSSLYALYAPEMIIVCLRYAKNRQEAEEILQDGFIRAFKFISQFKHEGLFAGWLRQIMVNCALQKLKNLQNLRPVVSLYIETCKQPDTDDIIGQLNGKDLLRLVQSLSPAYRKVFNLYVFEGMKHREIAKLLNISESTSKSNLSDARMILQKAIYKNLKIAK